jgi:hypothetical protein
MLGLLLLFLMNYMFGFTIFKIFFKKIHILEKIILPNLIGFIITPFVFLLLYFTIGFDSAVYILPILAITFFALSIKIKQKCYNVPIGKKSFLALIFIILWLMVMLLIPNVLNMPHFGNVGETSYHTSIANDIKNFKSVPSLDPFLYGTKINYPWIYHIFLALGSIYSGIPVVYIIHIFKPYFWLFFFFGNFIIGYNYFKKMWLGILFMLILSLFLFPNFFVPTTMDYSLCTITLYFYIIMNSFKNKSTRMAFLAGIVCSSIIYIHGVTFIFIALFHYSICLYLLFNRKLKQAIILALPLIFILPYYFAMKNVVTTMFLFVPFAGIAYNYLRIFNILLLSLILGIRKAVKEKNDVQIIFLISLTTLFTLVNTLVIVGGGFSIEYFIVFMIYPITFLSLYYIKDTKYVFKIIFTIICIALLLLPNLNYFNLYYAKAGYKTDEYNTAEWIRKNTDIENTILVSPFSFYISLAERRTVIVYPQIPSIYQQSPTEHFIDLVAMYYSPSKELYEKYNISYVIQCDKEFEFAKMYNFSLYNFSDSHAFKPVFSDGNCTIFKLIDLSGLSDSTIRFSKERLATSYYSRWWMF